ncbi:MAG TPA: HAMP domain-containing protein, partial [Terriglobales bacterium]|nr:HAMP domain-containing protein [Terriglobales bacterium]
MKLRTKFLIASLLISLGLTAACLLLVRSVIGKQVRTNVMDDLRNSVRTFKNVQQQQEDARIQAAKLVADLPIVRALMTTEDQRTIQDASGRLANLAEADLLMMAARDGQVMAFRTEVAGYGSDEAAEQLRQSLQTEDRTHWWFGNNRLYAVSIQPIYFGSANEGSMLGYVALGYEVDEQFVKELSQVADSEVAFIHGNTVVRSTLPALQRVDLLRQQPIAAQATELAFDNDHFLAQTLDLNPGRGVPVRLVVLKSLDKATSALRSLNRMLVLTGIIALTMGAILVFIISHTFTKPLQDLVDGVRALGRGDFDYPLPSHGHDEVAELTSVFNRMRASLRTTQRELLESEKLATIGRMASSVSHDLRHHLVAIMANAEYLADPRHSNEREELYQEVKDGVREMNDLIESLLEFSRTRRSLQTTHSHLADIVSHAVQSAQLHPVYQLIPTTLDIGPGCEGDMDIKKLGRVFHNLLINSYAAVAPTKG